MSLDCAKDPIYSVATKALRRWSKERLTIEPGSEGTKTCVFKLSGSTCNNMGLPIEAKMLVILDSNQRIVSTETRQASGDIGIAKMCAANENGEEFLRKHGAFEEAHGMTLETAAFSPWEVEPSGCFCSQGNRLHKWRNVLQAIHFKLESENKEMS